LKTAVVINDNVIGHNAIFKDKNIFSRHKKNKKPLCLFSCYLRVKDKKRIKSSKIVRSKKKNKKLLCVCSDDITKAQYNRALKIIVAEKEIRARYNQALKLFVTEKKYNQASKFFI